MSYTVSLLLVGLLAGISAGFFGIGGGLIIVPALVFLLGFTQHKATGTSLAVLLPPIGFMGVYQYWKADNVDIRAACIIGILLFFGAWLGGYYANKLKGPQLTLAFGIFAVVMGGYQIVTALQKMNLREPR